MCDETSNRIKPLVMRPYIIAALLSAALIVDAQVAESIENAGFDPDTSLAADAIIQRYVNEQKLAGVVALLAKKGEIVYYKAFGMQDIENNRKMQLNSSFQIASMTKPITSVALLILMEEGKVKLDDPITKYLPNYGSLIVETQDGSSVAPNTPLTLMHFLTHTSGLPNGGHPMFKSKVQLNKINSLAEYVDSFAALPLLHHPGERFTYGLNTNVVARVVEIVSGQPFEEFIKERIFDPLEMNSTYFFIPNDELHRFASIYSSTVSGLTLVQGPTTSPVKFPMGNGGLSSTALDYFQFAHMLLNGGELNGNRLLKKETVDLMTKNQLSENLVPLNIMGTVLPNTGFGLGVAVIDNQSNWSPAPLLFENMGNLPDGSFYWPGITNTYWWADPENEIVGVLLSQSTNPEKTTIFQEFHQVWYDDIYNYGVSVDGSAHKVMNTITDEERSFLLDHLSKTRRELLISIEGLSKKQLNYKMVPERWSIVEVIEHIAVTETSLWEWANAGLKEPADPARKSDVQVNEKMIIARLNDRVNKLDAPAEARPTGRYKKVNDALKYYGERRDKTVEFVKSTQEDLRNHFVKHHIAGTIDIYMALVLLSAHQNRHNLQIRDIMETDGFPK